VFGQPEHARGALRAILPAALAEALDWSTLALQPGSFVDAALRHQHTDLLYAAAWRDGSEALVYPLFEHQSTPPAEGLMAERLQDAIMTAGQQLIEQGRQQGIQGVLLRLLRQRFGDAVNVQVAQRIVTASLEQVEAWTGRVLSAGMLAEVIAD
jgi:predicted transposase YdaD